MMDLLFFLLGVHVATRLVAALYGIVDLGYNRSTHYPRIAGSILLWLFLGTLIYLLASPLYQTAFISGIGFFLIFHLGIYWVGKLIVRRISRAQGEDLSD